MLTRPLLVDPVASCRHSRLQVPSSKHKATGSISGSRVSCNLVNETSSWTSSRSQICFTGASNQPTRTLSLTPLNGTQTWDTKPRLITLNTASTPIPTHSESNRPRIGSSSRARTIHCGNLVWRFRRDTTIKITAVIHDVPASVR